MSKDNLGFVSSTVNLDHKEDATSETEIKTRPVSTIGRDKIFAVELKNVQKLNDESTIAYDPYKHREVDHPTTTWDTLFHFLKGSLGTGILAMPLAFKNAGYGVGFIGTVAIGFLCTYCIRLLVKSQYELCKRRRVPSLTYEATAEAAFLEGPNCLQLIGKAVPHIVNTFVLIYQLGSCCVYIVFISENLKSAVDSFAAAMELQYYMLAILLPLIVLNWIRNLKFLAPLSTAANAITVISFGIILYYVFRGNLTFESRHAIGKVQDFPLFFGTVLFALEAIGVIMPLENEMDNPKKFISRFGVVNVGMSLIILLYAGLGLFGYLCYGDEAKGSITLNLPKDILSAAVQILLAVSIFITYALQCYPAIDIIWNRYLSSRIRDDRKLIWEYVVRTLIVVATFLLAIAVPRLELFISLFGALCLSALGLMFPAIIETCTFWSVQEPLHNAFMLTKNITIFIFGILGLFIGTYTSLKKIIESFSE